MTPESPDSNPLPTTDNSTATDGATQAEKPAAPLNRAERRAQMKGKKGPAETGHLADLRQNNVHGVGGKQTGGKSNNRFMRKV